MPMPTHHALIQICTDCAQVIANGTDGWGLDSEGRELGELHALNMSDSDITLGASTDDCRQCGDSETYGECGSWFSWSRCECCGSTLGGDRMHATTWWSEADTAATVPHADYPHSPGYLIDCEACESECHCTDGAAECVWAGHDTDDTDPQGEGQGEGRTVSIPRGTAHLGSDAAWAMLADCEGVREISDACAVTVASWWQCPRGPGEAFTRLVSHFPVTVSELCEAVSYELAQMSMSPVAARDRVALGMLATWAINRHRGESVAA